jgi:hypothetical protein
MERLWDMISLRIKPFLDIQDVLVQCSVLMHSRGSGFERGVSEKTKSELRTSYRRILVTDWVRRQRFELAI